MPINEYLSDIENASWRSIHAGYPWLVIYARNGRIEASVELPHYDNPGFVCRLNGAHVVNGLTFRMRQKIGFRIAALIKSGQLS